MIALSPSIARVRRVVVAALLAATLAACAPAAPPTPTAAPKTEAKPTAAPAVASSPVTAASPAASPVSASPVASPAASPPAAASPAASPVAAAPSPGPSPAANPVPAPPFVGSSSAAGRVTALYTLPDVPIAAFQNAKLPGTVANDRKLLLGGIGSDLWHSPGDPADQFWMVTDRGPNGLVPVAGVARRTFPIPEFTPTIIKVRAANGVIEILEALPIVGQSGKPVTGLSNLEKIDETPYDFKAEALLPFNPNGLDTEGLVRTASGDFWLVEEYSPSLVKLDATGKVVKRYVPQGLALTGTDYPVVDTLPAIFGKRKLNRGFEALALSPDGKTLFIGLQSPLLNPDAATGNPSRMTRILAFDIASEKVTGEYAYQFEPVAAFDTTAVRQPAEMKISGLVALTNSSLLVLERTDWVAKLYRVDLTADANILGSAWDSAATAPSLEAVTDAASANLKILSKSLAIDLHELAGMPDKIEGVAVLDKNTLIVANDNDFDIGTLFDADGNNVGAGTKSRMLFITLTTPLPMP